MFVMGIVADVVNVNGDQVTFARAFENTGFKIRGEDFGQEGKDLELH